MSTRLGLALVVTGLLSSCLEIEETTAPEVDVKSVTSKFLADQDAFGYRVDVDLEGFPEVFERNFEDGDDADYFLGMVYSDTGTSNIYPQGTIFEGQFGLGIACPRETLKGIGDSLYRIDFETYCTGALIYVDFGLESELFKIYSIFFAPIEEVEF